MWVILPNNAGWDCFKILTLQEILRTQNPLLEEHCAFLEVIHLFQKSWMCKKQTSVSHSSTESQIISLDAGLRLDGIPALDLWDLIVFVLGNTIQTPDRTVQPVVNCDKDHGPNKRSQGMINVMKNIDCVPSNVQFSNQEALLYVFEDNEAVIKMIFKERSPTMRHVSRTQRDALDWLFDRINDRINLDSTIQIKYIDSKNQLADILTKGNFTRDEWNHLLNLFNISHFSCTACTAAMAKRAQQESGEERVTAKSRPMMSFIARAPSNLSSSTSESTGRKRSESQSPWSAKAEKYDRKGQPVIASWARTHEFQSSFSHEKTKHVILEEEETHDRTGTLGDQDRSAVGLIDDLAHKDLLFQQYGERTEKLSLQDKLSKNFYGCRIPECC